MTDRNFTEFHDSGFTERRQDPHSQTYRMLFDNLNSAIKELSVEVKEVKAKVNYHHATYVEATEKAIENAMNNAFPDGDPQGHRAHHELVIKREEARVKFWETMKTELGKWGLIGFLGWAGIALWKTFLMGPK